MGFAKVSPTVGAVTLWKELKAIDVHSFLSSKALLRFIKEMMPIMSGDI